VAYRIVLHNSRPRRKHRRALNKKGSNNETEADIKAVRARLHNPNLIKTEP
jgi:hypothetical protein